MITELINVGKILIDTFSEKKKLKKQRKEKLSSTLKTIGDLIHSVALDLSNNNYPHGSCAAMESLTDSFIQEIDDLLEDSQKQILKEALSLSTKLEAMYVQRNEPDFINKLEQASGQFYAASILVSF